MLSHSSLLIQPVQSLFLIILTVFSLEWALTHRCSPRILPDSSYFSGASQIHCKVWRKNELSSVRCLSPRSFQFFHFWFNLSNCHSGVPQQFLVVFLVVILCIWRPKKSFSSILFVLSKIHGSSFMPSCHNCFRLWDLFSPIRSNSRFANYILSSLQIPSHAGAPHIQSFLAIQFFRSAQDISKISVSTLHSLKISRGCSLIQAF